MVGRELVILNINDNPVDTFESGVGSAKYFIVHHVTTWKQVQFILSGRENIPPPDILLLDVSFDRDRFLRGASINNHNNLSQAIIPMGPILALPFLFFRPVMAFAPYSAHIDNKELKQYPPFLVAMGMIAAKMNHEFFSSKYLSLDNKDDSLDLFIDNLAAAGNPVKSLDIALPQYRTNLMKAINDNRLLVMNGQELTRQLQGLEEKVSSEAIVMGDEEVIDVPSDLYIEILDAQGNTDKINLVSLFADKLSWVKEFINQPGVTEILEWLNKVIGEEPAFVRAIKVIKKQDEEEQDGRLQRPRVDIVCKKLYGTLNEPERREIFRLCVLFANVHAYSMKENADLVKKEVYLRLGLDGDDGINTYVSWFGGRSKSSNPVCSRTIKVLPLLPFNPKLLDGDSDRYFLGPGVAISHDDDNLISRYRHHFSQSEGYVRWPKKPYMVV